MPVALIAAFTPPVEDVLDTVSIDDFSRWNLDLPVAVGQHGSWYRWWAGPHFSYSSMSQSTARLRAWRRVLM